MVEVEMCEYDIRNILTGNAPPLEFFPQIDQVEEVVIAELFQVFVARPVVDKYNLLFPVWQEPYQPVRHRIRLLHILFVSYIRNGRSGDV